MSPEQKLLLEKYANSVLAAPAHLHLTSDRSFNTFWERHIEDAIKLYGFIPPHYKGSSARVIDVGSGNGIPGIPISIIEPQWSVDLLDSDNKKCGFLDMFSKSNAINNVHVLVGRAELLSRGPLRASYQVAFCRALSKLRVSLELAAAFVQVGGLLIVPHGTSWKSEFAGKEILGDLGLEKPEELPYRLAKVSYTALLFKKVAETSPLYPRADGIPAKRPL